MIWEAEAKSSFKPHFICISISFKPFTPIPSSLSFTHSICPSPSINPIQSFLFWKPKALILGKGISICTQTPLTTDILSALGIRDYQKGSWSDSFKFWFFFLNSDLVVVSLFRFDWLHCVLRFACEDLADAMWILICPFFYLFWSVIGSFWFMTFEWQQLLIDLHRLSFLYYFIGFLLRFCWVTFSVETG